MRLGGGGVGFGVRLWMGRDMKRLVMKGGVGVTWVGMRMSVGMVAVGGVGWGMGRSGLKMSGVGISVVSGGSVKR